MTAEAGGHRGVAPSCDGARLEQSRAFVLCVPKTLLPVQMRLTYVGGSVPRPAVRAENLIVTVTSSVAILAVRL
jgi:hypothetical protein